MGSPASLFPLTTLIPCATVIAVRYEHIARYKKKGAVMTKNAEAAEISKRQAEILDIIFRLGEASVADLMEHLTESPTSGAVRRMLNILYAKGVVDFRHDGARKIYRARVDRKAATRRALKKVMSTFFEGSPARMMATLFETSTLSLSKDEKKTLYRLIEKARKKEDK
jgi:BlaI family penicillinase repressor